MKKTTIEAQGLHVVRRTNMGTQLFGNGGALVSKYSGRVAIDCCCADEAVLGFLTKPGGNAPCDNLFPRLRRNLRSFKVIHSLLVENIRRWTEQERLA